MLGKSASNVPTILSAAERNWARIRKFAGRMN
jgi:hypothetical protein